MCLRGGRGQPWLRPQRASFHLQALAGPGRKELTTCALSFLLRAKILSVRLLGCFDSGQCSQNQLPQGLNPKRHRRSCGSKKWNGCAPPGRRCGCCPTPWQTSASSGGCCTGQAAAGTRERQRMHLSDDSRAPLSPRSCRELREPEAVKTWWQRWQRRRQVARQHLREAAQRLAGGFGLWEGALYEIGGRIPRRPLLSTSPVSPSSLYNPRISPVHT